MNIIERAARAMVRRRHPGNEQFPDVTVTEWEDAQWRHHADDVVAVLQAVREPSEAMVEAGCHADIPGGRYGEPTFRESTIDDKDAPVIWQAMLDAALVSGTLLTREQGAKRLRDHYRAEGRAARASGNPIAECPYTPAAPLDREWGVQAASEWLRGWYGDEGHIGYLNRTAAEKVKQALALPLPATEDECGCDGVFDPWDIFPSFYGSYSSEFDRMAITTLRNIRDGILDHDDLARQMFREYLCHLNLCDYGTSPRGCFPTVEFRPLLPELIEKWHAYSKIQWDGDVMAEETDT